MVRDSNAGSSCKEGLSMPWNYGIDSVSIFVVECTRPVVRGEKPGPENPG